MTNEKLTHGLLDASSVGLDAGDTLLDEHGREIPDPVPMAPPVGYTRQPSLVELVRDMVRSEHLRRAAEADDKDDFETFDNFDIPDDVPDPSTRWENDFDPPVKELLKEGDKALKSKSASQPQAASAASGAPAGATSSSAQPPVNGAPQSVVPKPTS